MGIDTLANNAYNINKRRIKYISTILTITAFIAVVMPSQNVIYAYAGQEIATQIVSNPTMQEVLAKTQKLIAQKLDENLIKGKQ